MKMTNELYKKYENMIHQRAHKCFGIYDYDELVSIGNEIFCKAVLKFDENRGIQFSTYLYHQLRNMMNIANSNSNKFNLTLEDITLYHDLDRYEAVCDTGRSHTFNNGIIDFSEILGNIDINYELFEIHDAMKKELSEDAQILFNDLLMGVFEKSLESISVGGRARTFPTAIMAKHYDWTLSRTRNVRKEIKEWWETYAA